MGVMRFLKYGIDKLYLILKNRHVTPHFGILDIRHTYAYSGKHYQRRRFSYIGVLVKVKDAMQIVNSLSNYLVNGQFAGHCGLWHV